MKRFFGKLKKNKNNDGKRDKNTRNDQGKINDNNVKTEDKKKINKLIFQVDYIFPGQLKEDYGLQDIEDKVMTIIEKRKEILEKNGLNNIKHLIVDDSESNRFIMSKILSRIQVEHDEASNGLEALELVSQNEYQIIWIDLKMPILNGLEATKVLREFMSYNGIIVGVTGFSDTETKSICYQLGFNKVIGKPITIEIIKNINQNLSEGENKNKN